MIDLKPGLLGLHMQRAPAPQALPVWPAAHPMTPPTSPLQASCIGACMGPWDCFNTLFGGLMRDGQGLACGKMQTEHGLYWDDSLFGGLRTER